MLAERPARSRDHRQIDHFDGITEARIDLGLATTDGEPRRFPVQVDGDYIGDHAELELGDRPRRADVVA